MSDVQAWNRLTDLVTDDLRVAPLVRQSVEDPDGYLADHEDALAMRGIDDVEDVSGLTALIDALLEHGGIAYLDWKEAPDEARAQLESLPRVEDSGVDLASLDEIEGSVEEVAAAANVLLAPAGVTIVMLDEDSDAYPLVAVASARLDDLVETAAAVDVDARVL